MSGHLWRLRSPSFQERGSTVEGRRTHALCCSVLLCGTRPMGPLGPQTARPTFVGAAIFYRQVLISKVNKAIKEQPTKRHENNTKKTVAGCGVWTIRIGFWID